MKKSSFRILHIVAFDVPYPPNYGGVVDIYYKIKALSACGVDIVLHAYQYGREAQTELHRYCKQIIYYKRKTFRNPFYGKLPYITASRNSSLLLDQLLVNDAPILFEGLHCCYYLDHELLQKREKAVRTHNVEHDYYSHLERLEKNIFKRYFFKTEAAKLKEFESVLQHTNHIAAISPADTKYFEEQYPGKTFYLPAFHPNEKVDILKGRGDFCFYHGNLAVGENEEAAFFLIEKVFSRLPDIPLVIAGSNPSAALVKAIETYPNVKLLDKLSTSEMLQYIREAQVNILYTSQATGIKLKLINSLFGGRHCVANANMTANTGLESLCYEANSAEEYITHISDLWNKPFEESETKKREDILMKDFDNIGNAKKLIARLGI